MNRTDKKALVLDIDGTLTTSSKEITDVTKAAIWEMMDRGHAVVLASGRPTPGTKRYVQELELENRGGYLLSYNGAHVEDLRTGEALLDRFLPEQIPAEIYRYAKERGCGLISYEGAEVISAFEPDEYILLEARINFLPVRRVENFDTYVNFPVNKCLLTAPDEKAYAMEQELISIYGDTLSIYRSEPFFLEVMPRNISKGETILSVLDRMGVTQENLICCGDGYNDISMIEVAGVGVAMSNAQEKVREAADYVAPTNDEDGIADVIRKFIL